MIDRSAHLTARACLAIGLGVLLSGCAITHPTAAPPTSTNPVPSVAQSADEVPSALATESALPVESPSATPAEPPSALPTKSPILSTPTAAAPAVSLYIRMWSVNASVGPSNFFFSSLAISGGSLYYTLDRYSIRDETKPTPLYVSPMTATISQAGIRTIAARIEHDGLLGATHEFRCDGGAGGVAGAGTTYVQIVIGGVTHDLSGGCASESDVATPAPVPAPGTYGAFEDLLSHLEDMSGWLGHELGTPKAWDPTRMAVIADVPAEALWEGEIWGHPDPSPGTAQWKLGTWTNFGKLFDPSNSQERCAVLSGADLTTQLPSVKTAHAGTVFLDSVKEERVLAARPLLPNEPPPSFCD
jgi:hypothetical protein